MQQQPIKVLVVDDEQDFLELFVKRFKKRGLDVSSVSNGRAALEHLAQHPVDVVVLDVKMPRMDGLMVLKEIKARFPTVEVIMLTGHGCTESGLQGLSQGAFDYVLKPFSLDDLLHKIALAHAHRMERQQEPKRS